MSIRTIDDLQEKLDESFSWRIKELANYTTEIKRNDITEKVLIRAGIPLIYAHWEGFVKEASVLYIEFVQNQKKELRELEWSFISLGIRKLINDLQQSKNDEINSELIKLIMEKMNNKAKLTFEESIQSESNLSSKILKRILFTLNIGYLQYSTKEKLIDEKLLNARNKIAHGEYKNITKEEYYELKDEIISLMRLLKNDIENNVSLKKYIRTSA